MNRIGYKFEGVLVNTGKVGDMFGENSNNLLINNGEAGDWFGKFSRGPVTNNGKARPWFGAYSKSHVINNGEAGYNFGVFTKINGGHVIAITEPEDYGYSSSMFGRLLTSSECKRIPELKQYIEELSKITKAIKDEDSAKRFLEMYDPEPRERIEKEIIEILKGMEIGDLK